MLRPKSRSVGFCDLILKRYSSPRLLITNSSILGSWIWSIPWRISRHLRKLPPRLSSFAVRNKSCATLSNSGSFLFPRRGGIILVRASSWVLRLVEMNLLISISIFGSVRPRGRWYGRLLVCKASASDLKVCGLISFSGSSILPMRVIKSVKMS
ncbi:hypothetical protein ABW19_dt0200380 [Dactylella cylindrospora]|nr:hypothetical protein ABW19_dt0200380 [Dactylella cylindrospora]